MEDANVPGQLRSKTMVGISWTMFSQISRQVTRLIIDIILARFLAPDAYGLIGMVTVFTGFALIFTDMGFGAALVQKKDATEKHYNSIFWLNSLTGLVLTILFIVGAPLIASFYDQELLVPVTILIAFNFFIGSLGLIHKTLLRKMMDFRKLAIVELSALFIAGCIGVAMALTGYGIWSLAWQSVIMTFLTTIFLWIVSTWRPRRIYDSGAVKELFAFSGNLLGFQAANYWLRNGDYLLIGRFLGEIALGIYTKSYMLMLVPLRLISSNISQVMFPAFSVIQDDHKRIANIYLKITRTIAMITFPLSLGLWSVADEFVAVVFGEQWLAMIPVLRYLCIVGMMQSIGTLNGNLYLSQGRTDLQFKVGMIIGVLGLIFIYFGLQFGIVGVAIAYTVFSIIVFFPSVGIAVNLIGLHVYDVVKNLFPLLIYASTMAAIVTGVGLILPTDLIVWVQLVIKVLVGGLSYVGLILIFKPQAYSDILELVLSQKRLKQKGVT
ncbi:MAG: MOP flippase family protein [Anaerolineae bacterium]